MKMKEMKEKGIEFVKENKAAIAVGGSVFVYGVGMYLLGRKNGLVNGSKATLKYFKDEIDGGRFLNGLENGAGDYIRERFRNEAHLDNAFNPFEEAVKHLSNPENTKNVCGIVVLTKKNN